MLPAAGVAYYAAAQGASDAVYVWGRRWSIQGIMFNGSDVLGKMPPHTDDEVRVRHCLRVQHLVLEHQLVPSDLARRESSELQVSSLASHNIPVFSSFLSS